MENSPDLAEQRRAASALMRGLNSRSGQPATSRPERATGHAAGKPDPPSVRPRRAAGAVAPTMPTPVQATPRLPSLTDDAEDRAEGAELDEQLDTELDAELDTDHESNLAFANQVLRAIEANPGAYQPAVVDAARLYIKLAQTAERPPRPP